MTTETGPFIAGVQVVSASSRRFKQDIQDMDQASSDLMRLRPVTFRSYRSRPVQLPKKLVASRKQRFAFKLDNPTLTCT